MTFDEWWAEHGRRMADLFGVSQTWNIRSLVAWAWNAGIESAVRTAGFDGNDVLVEMARRFKCVFDEQMALSDGGKRP